MRNVSYKSFREIQNTHLDCMILEDEIARLSQNVGTELLFCAVSNLRRMQITHFMLNIIFQNSCCLWDSGEKYGRAGWATDDNIIEHMHFSCWIPKATNTYSSYVILIGYLQQQLLHEPASMVRYVYFAW